MKLFTAVLAPALLARAAATTFAAPFTSSDFRISGDAAVVGNELQLVNAPQQRGAVWLQTPVPSDEWTLEAVLRSTPDLSSDVGRSGFALWYTASANPLGPVHGGADLWDGLAVMMDSVGNTPSVRGHLSDGTYRFAGEVEKDALSLCRVQYRNAAGPITVRIGYSHEGFVVDVNGNKCFITTEISLPSGYFGVSADSDSARDVLSVERLEVSAGMKPALAAHLPQHAGERMTAPEAVASPPEAEGSQQQQQQQQQQQVAKDAPASGGTARVDAGQLQEAVAPVMRRLDYVDQKLTRLESVVNQLVDTLTVSLGQVSGDRASASGNEPDPAIHRELQALHAQLTDLRKDASQRDTESPSTGPGAWTLVLIVMAAQYAAVFIYKALGRRRLRHEKLI